MRNKTLGFFVGTIVALSVAGPDLAAAAAPAQVQVRQPAITGRSSQYQGPGVMIDSRSIVIEWADEVSGQVPYQWSAPVQNPNDRALLVRVDLEFVTAQGEVVHRDQATGQVGPESFLVLQAAGSIPATELGRVVEARGEPTSWWADEPFKIRTLAAFVDGLQRLEVFFVLEDWRGRPVTAAGTVDLYIVERERARAEFAGGGMRRRLSTLYARRFNVHTDDYARRRIGFINTDYSPPALTLGPIPYSLFDVEPRGDEGLVRVVFRTLSGVEIVAEDRVYF